MRGEYVLRHEANERDKNQGYRPMDDDDDGWWLVIIYIHLISIY